MKKEEMLATYKIQTNLHQEFKIACIRQGKTMQDVIVKMIVEWLKVHKEREEKV